MFEESLFESSGALHRCNPWTTALSVAVQALVACALVLLPMMYTQALPWRQLAETLTVPSPPPAAAPPRISARAQTSPTQPLLADGTIHAPSFIPGRVAMLQGDERETMGSDSGLVGVPGGIGTAVPDSVITKVIQSTPAMPKVVAPVKVRVSSGVAQGLLVHQVMPNYPPLAVQARIQGTVVLQAVVAKDGTVRDLHVVSGHPLLVQAALDAVRQWRYKPYLLNDQPVEVDTRINVRFTLGGQ